MVSTASPYKFAPDVLTAVAGKNAVAGLDAFACSDELEARSGMPVPQQVKALRSLPNSATRRTARRAAWRRRCWTLSAESKSPVENWKGLI